MTEAEINLIMSMNGLFVQRYELMLPNVFTAHDNEVDFLGIRKSGFCDEFEIKVSRADFLADKKKFVLWREPTAAEYSRHFNNWDNRQNLDWYKPKYEALEQGLMMVNYFSFVVPAGLVTVDEVPPFAGLIEVIEVSEGKRLRWLKDPVRLHKNKLNDNQKYQLARKGAFRYWNIRKQTGAAA